MSPGYDLYDNPDGSSLVYLNASDFESGTAVNVTKHVGFLHGFVEAITVILVSEVGDKTFFIAAILAMSNNKLTVFLAAISALALMTVLSALFGWVVTKFIPRTYTYYTCTVIMFLFGLKMLYEAWKMKPDEATELENEVREELERRGSIASSIRSNDAENNVEEEDEEGDNHSSIVRNGGSSEQQVPLQQQIEEDDAAAAAAAAAAAPRPKVVKPLKRVQIREKSLFGKT